ncbi:MAG: gluconate:H+ symporter [Spirosomataceae bacterium]
MLILLTLLGIAMLVVLIAYVKLDAFISFMLVSIGLGLACGMSIKAITDSLTKGIGSTLGSLVIIIGFGAMMGKIVADSGAAQRITDALIKLFGVKNMQWGMALAGFIVGLPLFYNAAFVIVIPLIFSVAASSRLPMMYVAVPMLSALSVAHGYLPPHPSPTAIANAFHADLSKTLIYGIIVAIPAIIAAGPIFSKFVKRITPQVDISMYAKKEGQDTNQPGVVVSFVVALLPVFLLTIPAPLKSWFSEDSVLYLLLSLISDPYIAMLISLLAAIYFLGLKRGQTMKFTMKQIEDAFKVVAGIMLIIGGAGALKQVLEDGGVSKYIAEQLGGMALSPLILGWGIAAIVRVCVGSATVAGLTTVGIVLPLVQQDSVKPELMVLAIGSGSLMFSHINDGGFWLFKEYFNLTIRETIMTWSIMETIVSIVGLLGVLALNLIV